MLFLSNLRLYHVNLNSNDIRTEGVSQLVEGMLNSKNSDFRTLCLDYNNIQKEGVLKLSHNLRAGPKFLKLEILTLRGNPISETGVMAIAENLPKNKTLKYLDLSDCSLDSKCFETLVFNLKSN